MTDQDLERLAWERLDGSISAEDDARLDALLAADSSASRRFEAIQELARGLSMVVPASPPAELRPRIDRAVAVASPRWRRPIARVGVWGPRLAYLAAGLVAGAVAVRLLLPVPVLDRDLASGAMITGSARPSAALELDLGGGGTLAMWRDGGFLNLDLSVEASHQVEVILEARRGSLSIERVALGGGAGAEAAADGAAVRIRTTGPGRSTIALSRDGEESGIVVRVASDGVVLAEREVRPDELGAHR